MSRPLATTIQGPSTKYCLHSTLLLPSLSLSLRPYRCMAIGHFYLEDILEVKIKTYDQSWRSVGLTEDCLGFEQAVDHIPVLSVYESLETRTGGRFGSKSMVCASTSSLTVTNCSLICLLSLWAKRARQRRPNSRGRWRSQQIITMSVACTPTVMNLGGHFGHWSGSCWCPKITQKNVKKC
jgi:hypothetical protein